jgi:hypothetical protein
MGEVVNVLVAFAVIIFLLRWITSGEVLSSSDTTITAISSGRKRFNRAEIRYRHLGFPTEKCDSRDGGWMWYFSRKLTTWF